MQHDTKALSVSYGNFGLVWLAHCHRASDPGLGVQNQRPGPGSSGGGNQTCPFLLIRCTTVFTQVYMIHEKESIFYCMFMKILTSTSSTQCTGNSNHREPCKLSALKFTTSSFFLLNLDICWGVLLYLLLRWISLSSSNPKKNIWHRGNKIFRASFGHSHQALLVSNSFS